MTRRRGSGTLPSNVTYAPGCGASLGFPGALRLVALFWVKGRGPLDGRRRKEGGEVVVPDAPTEVEIIVCEVGVVRGHVELRRRHAPERRRQRQRLRLVDVERRAGDAVRCEGLEKGVLVDGGAAAQRDEDARRLHFGKLGGAAKVARLRRVRQRGDDKVGAPEQLELVLDSINALREVVAFRSRAAAAGDDFHAKGFCQHRCLVRDAAPADEAHGLAF
mmetsp:Transcript_8704/g.30722  ORF Transcript_8704/g.30722 Transcript_8704/m.30722 type:complete len:219 (-) Transcript_8704:455-1111(-)